MNKKDMKIITHLRQNARMPLTIMSRKTNIPVSTIFDRLRISEKDIIMKHTSLLNFQALGFHTRTNIMIKVDRQDKEALKEALIKNHAVNSLYRINNGFDFMIECVFRQINDMEQFIETIESKFNILEHKSYFVIEDIKREGFMGDVQLLH